MMALQTVKPPEDTFKDRMINGLMSEETSRINALRAQYDSEFRVLRENHNADLKRLDDRHERYLSESRQSHEREIGNLRQSQEISLQAARGSFEVQCKMLEADNRRLHEQLTEARSDVKALREKVDKNKSIVEQMKELTAVKEALGIEDPTEEGVVEKIVGALSNPAALEALKGIIGSRQPAAATAPAATAAAQAEAAAAARPRAVRVPDGKIYMQQGQRLVGPLRPKKKVQQVPTLNPDGTAGPVLEIPAVDPEIIAQVVGFLERSFSANQDPVVVAQSYRTMVPPDIMTVIREHGVDVFLTRVAKLPGGSVLANQAGRNWVRKVGEALVE